MGLVYLLTYFCSSSSSKCSKYGTFANTETRHCSRRQGFVNWTLIQWVNDLQNLIPIWFMTYVSVSPSTRSNQLCTWAIMQEPQLLYSVSLLALDYGMWPLATHIPLYCYCKNGCVLHWFPFSLCARAHQSTVKPFLGSPSDTFPKKERKINLSSALLQFFYKARRVWCNLGISTALINLVAITQ